MNNSPQKVFLDANVVIQEGKEGSPIIERMVDLVDAGLVSVLTTDLTMTEVAKKHAENDLDLVKDFARPHIQKVLSVVLGAGISSGHQSGHESRTAQEASGSYGATVQRTEGRNSFNRRCKAF